MNRTKHYKISYALQVALIGICTGLIAFYWFPGVVFIALLIVTFSCLIAAEIFRRKTYGNLIRGANLIRKQQYLQAIVEFELFIKQATVKPWFNKMYLLSWSPYTTSSKALAWNNIGACHYNLLQLTDSREALDTAISLDPDFPIPYFNIAKIHRLENDEIQAQACFARSAELGLTGRLATVLVSRTYGVSLPVNRAMVFAEKLTDKAKGHSLMPYIETIEKLPPELESDLRNTSESAEHVLVMINDDSTPMIFVVALLVKCLNHERPEAHRVMLAVHKDNHAEIAAGTMDFLQRLQSHLLAITALHNYPLSFEIRKKQKTMALTL